MNGTATADDSTLTAATLEAQNEMAYAAYKAYVTTILHRWHG
jgi:hypothetical protein